ncbi:hypothetical protein JGU66_08925, partial [Myxococcaceae bacterium JPH2]|nr:hypothetical protein [Myxococcaceae bacterium JPH2]
MSKTHSVRLGISKFLAVSAVLTTGFLSGSAHGQTTQTFNYTGGLQSFTVPANVYAVNVKAVGARGGNAYNNSGAGAGAL